MSIMFLNQNDSSGLGLYSKAAKGIVQRMPAVTKLRSKSVRPMVRYSTEQDEEREDSHTMESFQADEVDHSLRKGSLGVSEPFTKCQSRQQRAQARECKIKNPAVGSYNPKYSPKHPKLVWNIMDAFQRSLQTRKSVDYHKSKGSHSISVSRRKLKTQTTLRDTLEPLRVQTKTLHQQLQKKLSNPECIPNPSMYKFPNNQPFIDMDRMLGRPTNRDCPRSQTEQQGSTFLTTEQSPLSAQTLKGVTQFNKQLSRQKVSPPAKRSANLVYDCNYSQIINVIRVTPDFSKMINRDGQSLEVQVNKLRHPDYRQIWMNRNKKSLPDLQQALKRDIKNPRLKMRTEPTNIQ